VREVEFLDYVDGELDEAEAREATSRIVAQLRRLRPQVVITFDPFGAYGHSDHVAICQLTTAAVLAAADPSFPSEAPPHRVSKLYYFVTTERRWAPYQVAFKRLTSSVDGAERGALSWPDWAVSAEIDTRRQWPTVWRAVRRHESQLAQYEALRDLSPEQQKSSGCRGLTTASSAQ
jgi:N-acetyl-1-D-myo-inositol-2-amino-2-deoxy-alpha-D-glucopyranoside deacetylase